jgi:triacylglycerol lipase
MFHVKHAEKVSLKYPLILVHGAGYRDKTLGLNYWSRIPRRLADHGVAVYYGNTDGWASIEQNGEFLKQTILEVLEREGAEKVNIIGHSRGGLEGRYVISVLGMDHAVASLTTISTPHRGVKAMNLALRFPRWFYRLVAFLTDSLFRLIGDRKPDFLTGSRELSERLVRDFNRRCPDRPSVYYQSYAAQMDHFFGDPQYLLTWPLVHWTDGANDGLCPVESAKWGSFRGLVRPKGFFGISHAGIIDAYRIRYQGYGLSNGVTCIDIPDFYLNIVRDLAARGF